MALPRLVGGSKSSQLRGDWRDMPGLQGGQAGGRRQAKGATCSRSRRERDSRGDLQASTRQPEGGRRVLERWVGALRKSAVAVCHCRTVGRDHGLFQCTEVNECVSTDCLSNLAKTLVGHILPCPKFACKSTVALF